jgi:peptidoglycan/xylan/chitin deacetylase (PgdA/CDA1 family)
VSLAVGTWLGVGKPYENEARAFGRRVVVAVSPNTAAPARPPPPPVEPPAAAVDAGALGRHDRVADLPRLNPDDSVRRAWLLAEGRAYAPGENEHLVTLTFDDGPNPETTPKLLELLQIHHLRAAFFFIGRYLDGDDAHGEAMRDLARQVSAAGQIIGNHTHDHRHLTEAPRAAALAQIDDGAESIRRATGQSPFFFRPPYGDLSRFLERTLAKRGTELVLWSIEAEDMLRDDPDAIADELKMRVEYSHGGIVLLHDVKPSSVHAFAKLLHWLNENRYDPDHPETPGYRIVDLYEYIRATAAHPQPFTTRQALDEARKAEWLKKHGGQAPPLPPLPSAGDKRLDVVL